MGASIQLTDWCRQERQRLALLLSALDSGRYKVGEDRGQGWLDLTQKNISRLKLHTSELNEILEQCDAEGAHGVIGVGAGAEEELGRRATQTDTSKYLALFPAA